MEKNGDIAIVAFPARDLDAANAKEFKRDVSLILKENDKLVFDLSSLEFIDSSGLGALISCLRIMSEKRGDLKLFGLTRKVRALFELVRLHNLFEIFGTREEALTSF